MLKIVKTRLREDTGGKIDELADKPHIDTSTLLSRLIEHRLKMELLKRSTQLYIEEKVSMWKAAQMAGVSSMK